MKRKRREEEGGERVRSEGEGRGMRRKAEGRGNECGVRRKDDEG